MTSGTRMRRTWTRITLAALLTLFAGLLAAQEKSEPSSSHILEMRLVSETPVEGWMEQEYPQGEGTMLYLSPEAALSNVDIEKAWPEEMPEGAGIGILFNEEGAKKLARLTGEHIGERLAILLDGNIMTAPTIRAQLTAGRALVQGHYTLEDAKAISEALNPAPPDGK